jgi:caffeoyl-CoA O-methyltransferase
MPVPEKLVITGAEIERYFYSLLPERDPVLSEMEELARRRQIPIVGPAVGRLFYLLAGMAGAKRVFELGSAIGYSTIWWARAAGAGAEVVYTDSSRENAGEALGFLRRAGVEDRVKQQIGDAIESLARSSGSFDVIFIDCDKHQYPDALTAALPRLKSGGLLVADNVLWHGEVARKDAEKNASREGILEFNRRIYSTPELFPVIVPLRDGVAVCRKM